MRADRPVALARAARSALLATIALAILGAGPASAQADIGRQLSWYHRAGMVTAPLRARDLVDGSFLEDALRALPR